MTARRNREDYEDIVLGSLQLITGRVIRLEHSVRKRDDESALRIVSEALAGRYPPEHDIAVTIPAEHVGGLVAIAQLFRERVDSLQNERRKAMERAQRQRDKDTRERKRFFGSRYRESVLDSKKPHPDKTTGDHEDDA